MVLPAAPFEGYRAALNKLEEEEILKAWREEKTKCDLLFWEEMRKSLDESLHATLATQKAKRW